MSFANPAFRMSRAARYRAAGRAPRLGTLREIIALTMLTMAAFVLGPVFAKAADQGRAFNLFLAGTLALILCYTCIRDVSMQRERMWTALFWFRLSSAVYCGFGSIVPYIVNERTEWFLRSVFDFTEADVLKVMQVFILSILCVVTVALLFSDPRPDTRRRTISTAVQNSALLKAAILFLTLGAVVRYGLILPRIYGISTLDLPGFINTMGKAYVAGLFLLMFHGLRTKSFTLILAIGLFLIDFAAGLIAFDKSEMLTSLIFFYLAVIFQEARLSRILVGTVAAFAVLLITQPLVHYGRAEVSALNGGVGKTATVEQRIDILQDYLNRETDGNSRNIEEKDPLLRLSFVNVASFVIDQYDKGQPADRYKHVFSVMVPRFFWPDKPITGAMGSETYELIRGRRGASIGTTHFAEAYWAYGWAGIPLIFLPGGVILSLISRYTIVSVRSDRWLRLPAMLIGVTIGHRVSGSFVTDVIGGGVIFLGIALLIRLAEICLNDPQHRVGGVSP